MRRPDLAEIIRKESRPLEPRETALEPRLEPLAGIRAVVWDIYGTLVISGSGDIGLATAEDREGPMREAMAAHGLQLQEGKVRVVDVFHNAIAEAQERRRAEGVEFPEVEIRDVWRAVLHELVEEGELEAGPGDAELDKLALDYECRVNPVWPMPGLADTLASLRERGVLMGIVSNAQFFTPALFEAFLDKDVDALGFDREARVYSFELREAKPSTRLYELLVSHLRKQGIQQHEVLYVGNDMRNDIWPASVVGLKTALFAGDQRSLRLRQDDPRVRDVRPDAVLTQLRQVLDITT